MFIVTVTTHKQKGQKNVCFFGVKSLQWLSSPIKRVSSEKELLFDRRTLKDDLIL